MRMTSRERVGSMYLGSLGRMVTRALLCRQCAPLVISKRIAVALSRWLSEKGVQNSKCLSLRSTTNRLRSIGSQFNNLCLNTLDCVKAVPWLKECGREASELVTCSSIACQLAKTSSSWNCCTG